MSPATEYNRLISRAGMRTLRVLYSFPIRLGECGIGMTAWHQVSGLLKNGVKVCLYCGSCKKPIKALDHLHETLTVCGIKLPIRLLGLRKALALHDKVVARNLRKIYKEIDIVHCWPSGAKETLIVARDLGVKTVLERPNTHTRYAFEVVQHECEKLGFKLPKSNSHAFNFHRLKREEKEFELTDRLLCPSDFVAQSFLAQGLGEDKISCHQYGVDPEQFRLPLNDKRKDSEIFKMVFIGGCEPRKGLHYALEAWLASKASKNGIFYICGKYIDGYRSLLAGKLAHPSIKEVGFLNDAVALLQKCHVLILPSIEEGSALVTYEARACGCVLLVSEASGARCSHMHDALVHKVKDIDSLREHIDLLASDKTFFEKLQKSSIAGLCNLTWEKAAETLVQIYQNLLNSD